MHRGSRESEHEEVYGKSFALYDKQEMAEFTDFFNQRFAANGLNPQAVLSGKHCLDAGCGGGRGTLFMLMHGTAHVTAVDVSPLNIETTTRNCRAFGFESFQCQQTTLEDLPFSDGQFDFVWCNGVIMHTANPHACLSEVTRVLKVDGQAWIYVYGAGGLYWYLIKEFREILSEISSLQLLAVLQLMDLPVRYIGEYMDDWKVPYLRTYTAEEFNAQLRELGFIEPQPLKRGVTYDTSERRTQYPRDASWYGEGDLRYLLKKGREPSARGIRLSDGDLTRNDRYAVEIRERFGPVSKSLRTIASANLVLAVLACSRLQRRLRDIFSESGPIDIAAIESDFRAVLEQARVASAP